mmetsp:Transcript_6707/g.8846  ORF Transcript_6707/g.8846 Transcript_6707/m.8846 type:complete len:94 (-) Transcript_6707:266-547(-)
MLEEIVNHKRLVIIINTLLPGSQHFSKKYINSLATSKEKSIICVENRNNEWLEKVEMIDDKKILFLDPNLTSHHQALWCDIWFSVHSKYQMIK